MSAGGSWPRLEPGPLIVALATCAGARLGEANLPSTTWPLGGCALAGLLGAWFVAGRPRVVVASIALALLASVSMARSLDGLNQHALLEPMRSGETLEFVATVSSPPESPRWSADVLARVGEARPVGAPAPLVQVDRTVVVVASSEHASPIRALEVGDAIRFTGTVSPLAPHRSHLRWRHVVAEVRMDRLVDASEATGITRLANALHAWVGDGASRLTSVDGALLRGFVLGDTRGVPEGVRDDFRGSGLTHLLAVSGSNVAFVLALVAPVLRRTSLAVRTLAALTVLTVFAVAARLEPSVLRAATMAALALGAHLVGRPVSTSRLLGGAVALLVLVDPLLVHSVAFGLSVSATLAIVALAGPLSRVVPGPPWLRDALSVAVAAQVGAAPIVLLVFGSMPLLAPAANLLAVPLAAPIMIVGLPLAVVAGLIGPAAPTLAAVLVSPATASLVWVRGVARVTAEISPAVGGIEVAAGSFAVVAAALALRRARSI